MIVVRGAFRSQNSKRSPKSAHSCSAKHIHKSKVLKTDGLGPLLDVELSEKEIDR